MPTLRMEVFNLHDNATSAMAVPRKLWLISTVIAKQDRPRHLTGASHKRTRPWISCAISEAKSVRHKPSYRCVATIG